MLTSMMDIFEESFNRYANREEGVEESWILNVDNTMSFEHWGDYVFGVPVVQISPAVVID